MSERESKDCSDCVPNDMNTGGRLVAGSHNRNEFVLINADESARVSKRSHLYFNKLSLDLGFSVSVLKSLPFSLFLDLGLTCTKFNFDLGFLTNFNLQLNVSVGRGIDFFFQSNSLFPVADTKCNQS